MKWQDRITKKELKHLKESGITTFKQAKATFKKQEAMREDDNSPMSEPCFQCKVIARKLTT